MSRIGNAQIDLPEGVEINISADNQVTVKGKLGELSEKVHQDIKVNIVEGVRLYEELILREGKLPDINGTIFI